MKRVALLGMPNTGKSTFFNRITGASARVANWPGTTVDLMVGKILVGGSMVEVIDLPGVYDLHGFSDDERLVRHFLENNSIDLVLIILNATQLDRQLSLALQIKQLGLPAVLLLNMSDEAARYGVSIDIRKMTELLTMPVALISAKYGAGYGEAWLTISQSLSQSHTTQPEDVQTLLQLDNRLEASMETVLQQTVQIPSLLPDHLTPKLDSLILHPWVGLPLFFTIMYLLFQSVFTLGAPLQAGLGTILENFRVLALEPLFQGLPVPLYGFLLDGLYNGVGTVASFVPLIILFFLFMAFVEDTGYMSRAAYMMDTFMSRLGLDGRSFVMMLMGFGCNVPALMGTRIMRSRPLRLLTMLVIPFSLCSARLQVFVFFIAALFSQQSAPLVLFSLYLISFLIAFGTALLFRGRFTNNEPFVIELPPYRLPTWKQMGLRAWHEVHHFLHRATKFIIGGVVLIWLLTHFPPGAQPAGVETWAGVIGSALSPVLTPIGIDLQLAITLIFGFVAKEIVLGALAVIYGMEGNALSGLIAHQLDWVQAYSFMLFTLVYTPCLSTVATLYGESKSWGYTVLAVLWPLGLAWILCFIFYQTVRALGY
jgi:ferrous iron transport protein B